MPRSLRAWLELLRVPNHFTALADVLAGCAYATGALEPTPLLVALMATSWLLYAAGMVLNDLFDVEQDRRERPTRPIPSGRISRRTAGYVGWGLLVGGVTLGCVASLLAPQTGSMAWRPAVVAFVLAGSIVTYDRVLKTTLVSPAVMGGCRALNFCLGMTAATPTVASRWFGFEPAGALAALALGIYVAGVTQFARDEASRPRRERLWSGLLVLAGGLALLACIHLFPPFASGLRSMRFTDSLAWPALIGLIGFTIVRRGAVAASSAQPDRIRAAVKHMILSIILLDAAIGLAVAGWSEAIFILLLLVPAWLLGKAIYST